MKKLLLAACVALSGCNVFGQTKDSSFIITIASGNNVTIYEYYICYKDTTMPWLSLTLKDTSTKNKSGVDTIYEWNHIGYLIDRAHILSEKEAKLKSSCPSILDAMDHAFEYWYLIGREDALREILYNQKPKRK